MIYIYYYYQYKLLYSCVFDTIDEALDRAYLDYKSGEARPGSIIDLCGRIIFNHEDLISRLKEYNGQERIKRIDKEEDLSNSNSQCGMFMDRLSNSF